MCVHCAYEMIVFFFPSFMCDECHYVHRVCVFFCPLSLSLCTHTYIIYASSSSSASYTIHSDTPKNSVSLCKNCKIAGVRDIERAVDRDRDRIYHHTFIIIVSRREEEYEQLEKREF